MKKFILTLVISFMMIFTANAQIATENAKFFDNTYVTAEAGVATPFTKPNSWFPLNTVVGLHVGKQFTPVWGAEVEGSAWFGSHQVMRPANRFDGYNHCFVRGQYVGVNGTVNFTNLFYGYNGAPRFFELGAMVGTGWEHVYVANNNDYNGLGVKTGLDFAFNLGKTKAHTVSVRPAVLWDINQPECKSYLSFNRRNAELYLGLAYTYHFKTSNGTHHFKTYDVGAMLSEIDRLNSELAKKPTEIVKTVEVVKTVENKATNAIEYATNDVEYATGFGVKETVFFAYDSAELDENAKATLDQLGQNGIYAVRGYASSEGSTEYNKALSLRRAEAVANYLRERGARVDTVEGLGVVFGPTTGRVAVITLK